jgi:hypothetical protein
MSGFIICTHHEILCGWSKVGGWNGRYIWHKRERSKMPAEFWLENPERKDHLEYLSTDGRKMWKWVLIKVGWVHADWIWLRKGTSGSSGHGNKLLGSIKFREVLGEMRNCQILTKGLCSISLSITFVGMGIHKVFQNKQCKVPEGQYEARYGAHWGLAVLEWPVNLPHTWHLLLVCVCACVHWYILLYVKQETVLIVLQMLDVMIKNLVV